MRNGYHKLRPGMSGLFLGTSIAVAGWFSPVAFADNTTANMVITAEVTSSCNVKVDRTTVDFDGISIREFEGKQAGQVLDNVTPGEFAVEVDCLGTSRYELTFMAFGNRTECIAAGLDEPSEDEGGGMQFCLYEGSDNKLSFTGASTTLQGSKSDDIRNFSVKPAAGNGLPTPGKHSASLVVTIEPK